MRILGIAPALSTWFGKATFLPITISLLHTVRAYAIPFTDGAKEGHKVRLLFRKVCSCSLTATDLPSPSLKVTSGFDTDDETPEVKVTLELLCAKCHSPWESFAGLAYEPKRPKLIIPS